MSTVATKLDWQHKGLPVRAEGLSAAALSALDIDILRGECLYPVAVLKESAIAHNSAWMQRFVAETGALLCPHGKTTMSQELFARQLADGAWGITAATASHVRMYRNFGIERIFLANQLVGRGNVNFVLDQLAADPGFDFYALVDSIDGVGLLADAARARQVGRPIKLLVEIGAVGGRTGVRDQATGLAVARAVVAAAPFLALCGIEAFEGIFQSGDADPTPVSTMLDRLDALASACDDEGLFAEGEVILSAGGSGFFDLCARRLADTPLSRAKVILRSGCYITHDNGLYDRLFTQIMARRPDLPPEGLRSALEVWSVIQSTPEPGRAIAALGKRDIGQDVEMPCPLWWFREGVHDAPQPMPQGYTVPVLYDQHAFVDGPDLLRVGDLVGFGVSHPCTTFDKWRMLFTVDDAYRVTGAVTTSF